MAILEMERAKAAIAASDVDEARELAAALEARFASLGLIVEVRVKGEDGEPFSEEDIAPSLRVQETWEDIDAELASHDAGAKSYGREDLLRMAKRP